MSGNVIMFLLYGAIGALWLLRGIFTMRSGEIPEKYRGRLSGKNAAGYSKYQGMGLIFTSITWFSLAMAEVWAALSLNFVYIGIGTAAVGVVILLISYMKFIR